MEHMTEIVYRVDYEKARQSEDKEVMFVLDGLLHKGIVSDILSPTKPNKYFPCMATIRIIDGLNKLVCTEIANIVWIKKTKWHTRLEELYKDGTHVEVQDK